MTGLLSIEAAEALEAESKRRRILDVVFAPTLSGKPLPARRWVVPGWIPDRAVTMVGGDGGTGKSLLSLQLMIACATGTPWLGFAVKQCKVFALFCEDDQDEIHLRVAAVCDQLGITFDDLDGVHWSARSGKANVLLQFDSNGSAKQTELWRALVAEIRALGCQLVIVDTLADVFSGNENYRGQARAFINMLRQLALEIDGAVILTAHPSVAGLSSGSGLSGSTAWNNSVRSRLYLTRPTGEGADPNERLLKRVKANYSGTGDQIRLRWQAGAFVALDPPTGIDRAAEASRAERVFLSLLAEHQRLGIPVSPSPKANNAAPTMFARHPDREGLSRQALEAAMFRLIRGGRVKAETKGPPSRQTTVLVHP